MEQAAKAIIERLQLSPHPEGGWYRETWRAQAEDEQRASCTAIHFLLEADQRSHWHRVDAVEIWHHYAGAPLVLEMAESEHGPIRRMKLGDDLAAGERPHGIVPAGHWHAAESIGDWTLVGCTVAPGFEFASFEMAAPDWTPQG